MSSRPTVLVVEDDADVRDIVILVLSLHGYEAIGAGDGEEAWDRLMAGLHPALILLDLRMPRLDGSALTRRIQADAELRAIPLVIMSGEIHARQEAGALGVHEFLEKPVGLMELVEMVGRCSRATARDQV